MSALLIGDRHVARLFVEKDPALEEIYVQCISSAVKELLHAENLSARDINVVLPPQISPGFISNLANSLGIVRDRFIDVSERGDLFTSSLPFGFARLCAERKPASGALGLIVNVAAGIQVGCALYHF